MRKLRIVTCIVALLMSFASCSQKCNEPYPEGKHLVNTDEDGKNIAMDGLDLVSFFESDIKKGSSENSSSYKGITYLFSSEENKKAFDINPSKFLPEYGGFCAVAAYFGKAEELQTYALYEVVDGKLYFNKNEKANKLWKKKTPKVIIEQSNKNWNCIVSELGLDINQPYSEPESIK